IELTMAVLFVTAALAVEDPARLALILAATPVMVALAVIDIEVRRLPNVLVALLAAAALVFRFLTDRDFVFAFAAAVAIFGFALLLDRIGRRLLHQGLGMGDAKLMSVVALALPLIPLLLVLGAAGTIGALTGVAWHRRLTGSATQIPFAPAILSAFWAALVAL
ncbi:MAG: prepilin peptidase, partial [Rhizobiaceae bacterium]